MIYRCKNGMIDAASPIVVVGRHLANVFVGQFLLAEPDRVSFQKQADDFDFEGILALANDLEKMSG